MISTSVNSSEKRLEALTSPSFQTFLKNHQETDITRLLLSKSPVDVKEAANQIISRRKAKDKLPSWYATASAVYPPPLSVEQSSSEEAAEYKKNLIFGNLLVDLTGGMGVDCLALSRNFKQTIFVEQDEWLCTLFRHNQKHLSKREVQVENATAEAFLDRFKGKAIFFIDPARRDASQNKVYLFEDCSPNLIQLIDQFRTKAEKVLVKAAPLMDISMSISQLTHVKEVHVLSIKNEVKEVLILMDFTYTKEPVIHCVNLRDNQPDFKFKFSEEKETALIHGTPKRYLYDPNSSILKAGAFKSVAVHFPIQKLNANTHLYTSDDLIENFPGRRFEVLKEDLKKNEIPRYIPEMKANVFTKNYPLKPEALKKNLNINDGGDHFIIGFRDSAGKPRLTLGKRV